MDNDSVFTEENSSDEIEEIQVSSEDGTVLSGIGTDWPARRRPAALDRPGTPGRAHARRAPAVRAMT
jgi:hypothetical protein